MHTMKKYQRSEQKKRSSLELEETFEFLREMKWLELYSCTEYQSASREHKDPLAWFEIWQDTGVILDGKIKAEHVCTCFKNFYPIIQKRYPSFEREIWDF